MSHLNLPNSMTSQISFFSITKAHISSLWFGTRCDHHQQMCNSLQGISELGFCTESQYDSLMRGRWKIYYSLTLLECKKSGNVPTYRSMPPPNSLIWPIYTSVRSWCGEVRGKNKNKQTKMAYIILIPLKPLMPCKSPALASATMGDSSQSTWHFGGCLMWAVHIFL